MIENIDKPALSALWPNKKGMSVVLDLGANIECNSKNLIDFSIMGSALYKALFDDQRPQVALLNIGSEELKGNATIKDTYQLLNDKNYKIGDSISLKIDNQELTVKWCDNYKNEKIGAIGIVIDSWGMVSLFLSNGNAQKLLNCKDNSKVTIKV